MIDVRIEIYNFAQEIASFVVKKDKSPLITEVALALAWRSYLFAMSYSKDEVIQKTQILIETYGKEEKEND